MKIVPKNHNVSHATFIQAAAVIILTAINGVFSGLDSCFGHDKTDCTTNSVLAVVLVILAIGWFGFLSAMAYAAWIRRTTALIIIFILVEIITTGVSGFDLIHSGSGNALGLISSLIDLLAGLWVLYMSYFLLRLRGTSSAPPTGRERSKLNRDKPS